MIFREKQPKRRSNVVLKTNYRDYRSELREDFNCRCGYCNDLDIPRKEYIEIDHFVPRKIMVVKKINDYQNLVYACHSCNNAKGAIWPSGDENVPIVEDKGWIDPCSEDYANQFSRDDDGRIVPITAIGKWMYEKLRLYKQQHFVLWNIEQLKLISGELDSKIYEDPENIELYKQFYLLSKEIGKWSERLYH